MTNIFKKLILFSCVVLMATHSSWSQSIVILPYTSSNCTGSGTANLAVSPTTGITSYSWRIAGTSTVVATNASTAVLPSGSYTVTYVKNGVPGTTSIAVVAAGIFPTAPTVTPTTVATPLCPVASSSQILTSSTVSNYTWNRNGVALSPAVTTNSISVLGNSVGAGTYNYSVTTTNTLTNCTATSNAVAITILAKPAGPTISAPTPQDPICDVSTKTLTASNIGSAVYVWKRNGVILTTSTTNSLVVTGSDVSVPGTYNYTVSSQNATGCVSDESAPFALKLSPKPATPSITPATFTPNVICGSDSKTLTATVGGTSYIWRRSDNILTGTTSNSLDISGTDVSVAGTYSYTVSSINSVGCSSDYSSAAVTLQLFPASSLPSQPTITSVGGVNILSNVVGACEGTSVGLTSSYVSNSNVWSLISGNDVVTTGTNGIVINTVGSFIYSVKARDNNGCLSPSSNVIQVIVYAKPITPTITTPTTPTQICGSEVKTLTATPGGASYTWIRNTTTTLNAPNTNVYNVTGSSVIAAGTYSFTVASNESHFATRNGPSVTCTSDISQPVTIKLFPTTPTQPIINSSIAPTNGVVTFCEGGTVNLNYSRGVSTDIKVWSRTANGDTTTINSEALIVRSTNTITLKTKDSDGCLSTASNPITVNVNPRPLRPNLNRIGNIEICELDSTILSAVNGYGAGTYFWKKDGLDISSQTNIYVKSNGNYTLVFRENINQCSSLVSLPTNLTVNLLPVKPTLTTFESRPLEYCYKNANSGFNFATLLASSSTPNVKFLWDNGRIANTIDTTIAFRSTKTETIKITAITISSKGCKSKDKSDEITITVYPLPTTPNIAANGPITFCPDSTVSLTSTDSPNGVYKWINAKNSSEFSDKKTVLIDTTSKFFNITPLGKVGKFYVRTISDKSCLSDTSKNVIVTVREAPLKAVINPSPISATVCLGGKVTLKALFSNGNVNRYSWRDETTKQEVSTEQEVTIIASGIFSVKVRDVFGCFADNSDVLKVTISPLPSKPIITTIKPKIFCDEDSTIVQSSLPTTTPNGKNLYTWIVDGQTVLQTISRTFSWKKASSISVAVTDSNGCKALIVSDTIRTTVNPLPASPSITVRGAIPFCADKSVTLSAIGTNGVTFKWSTGATTANINTNVAGNVTVQAINGFGCLSKPSQAVDVRVNQLPETPTLSVNNAATVFCDGSKVRIIASSKTLIKDTYWWRSTTDSIGRGEDINSIFAAKTGNYFGKIQDDKGCISLASTPIAIDVRPNPTPTVVKQIGTFSLDAQGVGDENGYIWRLNDVIKPDLTTRIIKAKQDGDYKVQASISYTGLAIAGGKLVCYSNTSEAIKYVQDLSFSGFSIFPNPSPNGEINVEVIEDLIGANITIYDLYGKLIAEYKVDKFNTLKKIQLPNYHGNTYIVKITTDGFDRTRKVITLRQ